MRLIDPDFLTEACGLSPAITGGAFALGLLIWLFGWWGHRFWIVLAMTASAGIIGLSLGPDYGGRPSLAGLLLAVASGVMALALVRVVVFAAGGLAGWGVAHLFFPGWGDVVVCFLLWGV